MTAFKKYWIFTVIGTMLASVYPLFMGGRVIWDMATRGFVLMERYPKYIIPYTPISVAIIFGIAFLPLFIRFFKKHAFTVCSILSTAMFFVFELLLENNVVVSSAEAVAVKLEDWQMYMCYYVPTERTITVYRTQTAVDILMGDYNPAFKFHFYIISVVIVITVLNCAYGFAHIVRTADKKRLKPLILQAVFTVVFISLCILACFTAFWRDGSIEVSALSAILMSLFFVIFGQTSGMFVNSVLIKKQRKGTVILTSLSASAMTLLMYIGEMILLNGHLYSFGQGAFYEAIPYIVLAPVDILTIFASGCMAAVVARKTVKKN